MQNKKQYYYRFIYKNISGQIENAIINVLYHDNELAIAKFENMYPGSVWWSFIEINN